ncbi:hypothetical protein JTE90_008475 [Oedothorax gibbosus]|uniref:Uncharacterized protein n=1 Tax=Oedothorax gibbosus TaxID=931172 RepID=A0AAV6UZ53_9ARAC|nr:hypothetical protein JTE90_008475 [Oedothorax gibbosus]
MIITERNLSSNTEPHKNYTDKREKPPWIKNILKRGRGIQKKNNRRHPPLHPALLSFPCDASGGDVTLAPAGCFCLSSRLLASIKEALICTRKEGLRSRKMPVSPCLAPLLGGKTLSPLKSGFQFTLSRTDEMDWNYSLTR